MVEAVNDGSAHRKPADVADSYKVVGEASGASTEHRALRILIVALNYAPELVGCAKYTTELAEALVADGHKVEVVCAPPYYPSWKIQDGYSGGAWSQEERNGVKLHRTPLYIPSRVTGLSRLVHLASFGASTLPAAVVVARRFQPDLVFNVAPSLTSSISALAAAKVSGANSWLHIQDFEVDAAFDLGLLTSRTGRGVALAIERTIFRAFDRLSTISTAMVSLLVSKGVSPEAVIELRNWVDLEKTPRLASSNTKYRAELGIGHDDIVALYSGNMAAKQGIEMLAEVAKLTAARKPGIRFIFCGEGPARQKLTDACGDLRNVSFLPLQPLDRLPELLGTADIHLLPQRPEAADLVLPSKLTGMLASGRPVVAMAEAGSGLAEEVSGCGIAVKANASSMAEAVIQLAGDTTLRQTYGDAARARAELAWSKKHIVKSFIDSFRSLGDVQ